MTDVADYPAALALAFSCSDQVLVEAFVPLGREVRCGIVVEGGALRMLPLADGSDYGGSLRNPAG